MNGGSRKTSSNGTGNGLVILKENGEFITHLRIDQGGRLIDDYFKLVSEANG